MVVVHPAMRAGGPRTQDAPLYGPETRARRNPMGVTHLAMRAGGPRTQDAPLYGPEARARRMPHYTGWRPVLAETRWASHT
jgi:hypothetical protein